MRQSESDKNSIKLKKGFWRRQFQSEATVSQKIFDWLFGAILPVICFVFDPFVFKRGIPSTLLGNLRPFAYILSFVSIMAISAWLIWGAKLKWFNALLAGLFFVGGLISFGVGWILFPYSVIGLCYYIGILGFTPFFSSLVFLRNSFRTFQAAKPFLENGVLIRSFILTAIFSVIVPTVININLERLIDEMETSDAATIRANARILKYAVPLVNLERIAGRYYIAAPDDKETEENKAIADVYEELTGEKIRR